MIRDADETNEDYICRLEELTDALLAAAKDMLACLDTPSEQVSPSWTIGARQRARAAIAKAEESTP